MKSIFQYLDCHRGFKNYRGNNERYNKLSQLNLVFFNTTVASLGSNNFLFCIRFIGYSKTPIPGNDKSCNNPFEIGENFIWNHWYIPSEASGSLFFIGTPTDFVLVDPLDSWLNSLDDFRLIKMNNEIRLQNANLAHISKLEIKNDNLIIGDSFYVVPKEIKSKNQQLLTIYGPDPVIPVILDWFYIEGIRKILLLHSKETIKIGLTGELSGYFYKFEYISTPNSQYVIDGNGSYLDNNPENILKFGNNYGIIPKFSFSTPLITKKIPPSPNILKLLDLPPQFQDIDIKLGVGHLKIHSDPIDFPYIEISNINNFRQKLYENMNLQFGKKYIRHLGTGVPPICFGYIYMLYFFIIYDSDKKMKMSDAYLPINYDTDGYKFSLIFPSGLESIDSRIIVTAGEGDYYSVFLEFDLDEVLNLCIHDATQLNMRDYKYKIIKYQNGKASFDDYTQIGGKRYKLSA